MTDYKLTYFDIRGGRGEPIRIAMHAAGITFDDHRITFQEFGETRQSFRFGCVPILEIDDTVVTQSNAMLRYFGQLAGLYPEDPLQALYCDEVMGACEDSFHQVVKTFGKQGEQLAAARQKLTEQWFVPFFTGIGELLERGGDRYFADERLTVADLKIVAHVGSVRAGTLEHVPTDLIDEIAPNLVAHQERVQKDPIVEAYYASL
ncbi:MAG: glutathione S-transferase family protein [Pseudomonadota bacterium]